MRRLLALIVGPLMLAGVLLAFSPTPPAQAHIGCNQKHNRQVSHLTWFDGGGTAHRGYVAIGADLAANCQDWRYAVQMWCTYQPSGSSSEYAEPCNYDMQNGGLILKTCYASAITFPWGTADRNTQNATTTTFLGGWHNPQDGACDGLPYTPYIAMAGNFAWRFLRPSPDHLTAHYCLANSWHSVPWNYGDHSVPSQNYCSTI